MNRLSKIKMIWLAVALVPLLVAVGCGGESDDLPLPYYTPIPIEDENFPFDDGVCVMYEVIPLVANESDNSWPFDYACITIPPERDHYMVVELSHPIYQIAISCDLSGDLCRPVRDFYLDLLATDPTLSIFEAMQLFEKWRMMP